MSSLNLSILTDLVMIWTWALLDLLRAVTPFPRKLISLRATLLYTMNAYLKIDLVWWMRTGICYHGDLPRLNKNCHLKPKESCFGVKSFKDAFVSFFFYLFLSWHIFFFLPIKAKGDSSFVSTCHGQNWKRISVFLSQLTVKMARCVYVRLLTVNVLVVCIVLHDGPDRQRLATCLEHRGPGYDVQPCRCSGQAAAQKQGLSRLSVQTKKQEGSLTDRRTSRQTDTCFAFVLSVSGRGAGKTGQSFVFKTGAFVQLGDGQEQTCEALII